MNHISTDIMLLLKRIILCVFCFVFAASFMNPLNAAANIGTSALSFTPVDGGVLSGSAVRQNYSEHCSFLSVKATNGYFYDNEVCEGNNFLYLKNWIQQYPIKYNVTYFALPTQAILYRSFVGTDDKLYYQKAPAFHGQSWEFVNVPTAYVAGAPTYATLFKTNSTSVIIVEAVKGTDGYTYQRYALESENNGKPLQNFNWSTFSRGGLTQSSVSMAVMDNFAIGKNSTIYQSILGTDGYTYTRFSNDASNWSIWKRGGLSKTAPILVAPTEYCNCDVGLLNPRVFESILGTDNYTYQRYSTDGINWTIYERGGISASHPQTTIFAYKFSSSLQKNIYTLLQTIKGTDGYIYTRYADAGQGWSIWKRGGITASNGSTGGARMLWYDSNAGGVIESIKGTDGNIYVRVTYNGYDWTNYTSN